MQTFQPFDLSLHAMALLKYLANPDPSSPIYADPTMVATLVVMAGKACCLKYLNIIFLIFGHRNPGYSALNAGSGFVQNEPWPLPSIRNFFSCSVRK
jgi:hypothetical protein